LDSPSQAPRMSEWLREELDWAAANATGRKRAPAEMRDRMLSRGQAMPRKGEKKELQARQGMRKE